MPPKSRLNFARTKLVSLSFEGQNLAGADFSDTYINNCNFNKANLTGANFSRCRIGHGKIVLRRKLLTSFINSSVMVTVLMAARLNNSAFITASFLAVSLIIVAQFEKYTPSLSWLWAASLPATLYLSAGALFRMYLNLSDGLLGVGLAYGIVMLVFAGISIMFAINLVDGIRPVGASFRGANLTQANFKNARIINGDFENTKMLRSMWDRAMLFQCKFPSNQPPVGAIVYKPNENLNGTLGESVGEDLGESLGENLSDSAQVGVSLRHDDQSINPESFL